MRNIGLARLAVMGVVAVFLVGFFLFLMTRMTAQPMALLYSDISASDAGAIGQKLDAMKIPFEVNPEGTAIRVPSDQVGRARMSLAQDGLPSGGSLGYHEIFDQNQSFGTTSFMQNLNQVRALEGELARTVASLSPVKSARIHLVLPKHELFSRDQQPATASAVLQLRPGAKLSHEQISAIQHLIASAVPQLKPTQVSIVDDHGNLLARPENGDSDEATAQTNEDMRHAYEARLAREIETMVGRTVGDDKVKATVTADLDYDRISTSQESFDPDQQVVRSTQTVAEKNDSNDSSKDGAVSVANNVPGQASNASGGNSSSTKGQRSEETVNYEIGKTTKSQVRQGGQVRKLSIAVLVDGAYTTAEDGKVTYAPRSKEEMSQIETMVKSATGYDVKRGDTIDVTNMRFANDVEAGGTASDGGGIMGFDKSDIIHLAETGVLGIVALLVVLLVVRPILNRLSSASGAIADAHGGNGNAQAYLPQGMAPPALSAPTSGNVEAMGGGSDASSRQSDSGSDEDMMIDLDRVDGRVRASSLKKIGEIVEKHPNEAVSIVRGWMYQES